MARSGDKQMPFVVRTFFLAFAASLLAACSMLSMPDMRMGAAPARVVVAGPPFNAVERDFVTKIATRTVYEIEVSRLAADRALSPAVRDYAGRLVQDDTLMNDDLVALMSAHGVAPPKGLPADKSTKLHKLASLQRSDAFDSGYIRVVGIEDRRKAIAMFEKTRARMRDPDLRAWIDRSLTVMRAHLTNAQGIAASLAG
jgi:putative membrane protein